MELIKGIIMDWVILSEYVIQPINYRITIIHFYNALLLFPPPAIMVVSAVKNTTFYLLLLLMLIVFLLIWTKSGPFSVVFIIWRMGV